MYIGTNVPCTSHPATTIISTFQATTEGYFKAILRLAVFHWVKQDPHLVQRKQSFTLYPDQLGEGVGEKGAGWIHSASS